MNNFEDFLNNQLDYFCRWKCNKNCKIEVQTFCPDCEEDIYEDVGFELCEYCQIKEFIHYIRDEKFKVD